MRGAPFGDVRVTGTDGVVVRAVVETVRWWAVVVEEPRGRDDSEDSDRGTHERNSLPSWHDRIIAGSGGRIEHAELP